MRKQFTIDDYSHYVFSPRDLTSWVLGLMRYPLVPPDEGASAPQPQDALLEIWAYEACRLFRDRIVGQKSQEKFDAILKSVVQSDWSVGLSCLEPELEGGAMYVTWGSIHQQGGNDTYNPHFGRPLGRLSSSHMQDVVAKALMAYGE